MLKNILNMLFKILIKLGLKNKQEESLKEKDEYFKNLKLKDMIKNYNYMENHYIKRIKNIRDNKNVAIVIVLEVAFFSLAMFIEYSCSKDFGYTTLFVEGVKYLTVNIPILVYIYNLREKKNDLEIEYKEKQNRLKWEIFDLADELTESNLLTDENKKALKDTFKEEFSNKNNDNDLKKQDEQKD